ncbi:MAG TPA: hypothetical protein VFU21_20905 [Kofleriaceae bacterium]|nr:hypothetical protein [Kofleriaceae bacterium]
MRIDVDRVARSTAPVLGAPHRRPPVAVSMVLRRLIDVFVGRVRAAAGDFYFDFERVLAGEPLDRAVRRIGALAHPADPDGWTFVHELGARGVRIAIDLPAFSTAFTARDPQLAQHPRRPLYAVWFDGVHIRIRDTLLFSVLGRGRQPAARLMPDLLDSERSLRLFLAVVNEALT